MHIVIGGAYNGKCAYVAEKVSNAQWFDGIMPTKESEYDTIVIVNIEQYVQLFLQEDELVVAHNISREIKDLENENIYIILNDFGRGIVPLEPEARKLRDICGRLYQQLFKEAQTITRIWYGIPQQLKG